MSILTVEHLTHGFGDRAIFSDVSFRLLRGEHIGLVGANGEGKSTFFNIVTGHLTPDEGKIEWAKNVRIGYLDQHTVLEKGMTIRDVLKSAFAWLFELEQKMNDICDQLGSASEDEMESMMEELGSRKKQIKIGIPPMIGTFLFPKLFTAFRKKYPNIDLELVEGGSPDSLLAVENDAIDLAVIITNGIKKPDIHIEPLCSTEFMFCVGRDHPLAGRAYVTFEDIKDESLILFKNGYFQNSFVRSRFAEINAEPNIILYSNQIMTMKNLVRECGVCAFLIRDVVKNDSGLSAIPIDPPIPIEIGVIWRKNKRHSSDTIQFIKFVNEMKNTFVSG